MLFEARTRAGSQFLIDLHVRLLRGLNAAETGDKVTEQNWETIFLDEFERRMPEDEEFPFSAQSLAMPAVAASAGQEALPARPAAESTYRLLPCTKRLSLLHELCEWRLCDAENCPAAEQMDLDPDSMRLEALGMDVQGNIYWHFSGLRLYREAPAKQRKRPHGGIHDPVLPCTSKNNRTAKRNVNKWNLVCETPQGWLDLGKSLTNKVFILLLYYFIHS